MTPVHKRVWAGTIGAGTGATISTLILWLLGVIVWDQPATAAGAEDAITAVPAPVAAAVLLAVTVGLTFLAGWLPADDTTDPAAETAAELTPAAALEYADDAGVGLDITGDELADLDGDSWAASSGT